MDRDRRYHQSSRDLSPPTHIRDPNNDGNHLHLHHNNSRRVSYSPKGSISRRENNSGGLRNRRLSDNPSRSSSHDRVRSSNGSNFNSNPSLRYYDSEAIDGLTADRFFANDSHHYHGSKADKHRANRTVRCISLGITSIIFLYLCIWGIETCIDVMRVTFTSFRHEVEDNTEQQLVTIKDDKEKRRMQIKDQLAKIESQDRGLLRGPGGGISDHFNMNKSKKPVIDTQQTIKTDETINAINYLGQNQGRDATLDFFYAGKLTYHEEEVDDPFNAYSYAILPFSDDNSFAISVWIYLSSEAERGENTIDSEEGKPPRVVLTTRTYQSGEGCISDLFGGSDSSSQAATGMILYAQPNYSDEIESGQTYRMMLDYAVASEMRCRTLIGVNTALIREGEWHHIVLFASQTGSKNDIESNQGVERMSLYINGDLAARDEQAIDRICGNCGNYSERNTHVGRYELLNANSDANNVPESRFDLNGRVGLLAFWETGGSEVITTRMKVQSITDEEHVVRSINRARFDVAAIKDLSLQGLTVKEPNLLFTFDEPRDINNHTKLMLPSSIKEVMTDLHGKTNVISPYMQTTFDLALIDEPFVVMGGNRYTEYKDGTFISPKRTNIEMKQLDELARVRSVHVKEAMKHLWAGYKKFAWTQDELLPLSDGGQDNWGGMMTTLVDSLSTLWLLGMKDEFWEARDTIKGLNFNGVKKAVSLFETTIRNLGSLISAYDLSGDKLFLQQADDLGSKLLKAFNTPSGVPRNEVELFDGGKSFNTVWHSTSAALAEIGTLQIEFRYLGHATGKTEYAIISMRALDELLKLQPETGLYPTLIHNLKSSLSFANDDISIGAMGDSFYEYLLKVWLQGGKKETFYRTMYDKAIDGIMDKLICRKNGLTYVAELKNGKIDHKMDHLSCFLGGNMALGAYTHPDGLNSHKAQRQLITGKQLAYTCYQMYARGKYGLPSEYVRFDSAKDDFTVAHDAPYYILRPETAETFFILHHLTKDNVYREWGWEIFRAIDKSCRTESGYAALANVNTGRKNNRMESFFPSETIKYLFLLQDSSHKLDLLNKHVFNTEAHPLRVFDQ